MRNVHPPTANTKRRTILFFELGMILALSFVLWAFNYSSVASLPDLNEYDTKNTEHEVEQIGEVIIEPDDLLATKTEKLTKSEKFKIVPDPTVLPDPGPAPDPIPSIKPGDGVKLLINEGKDTDRGSDNTPVSWASKMPEFPGGNDAMMAFISKNLMYPDLAIENGIQGRVMLTFVIEKDGSISNIAILNSVGWGIDDEAMRVVKLMPKWSPGENNYRPVRVRVNLPVKFVFN